MKVTKKIFASLLFVLILLSSISCDGVFEYHGEYKALYYETLYSVAGIQNMDTDSIVVVETDDFGRTLYYMYINFNQVAAYNGGFLALLISQQATDEMVYYYEDINYILFDLPVHISSSTEETFLMENQDEIDSFKVRNDWNQDLDYTKCYSKSATDFDNEYKDIESDVERMIDSEIVDEIYGTDYRIIDIPLDFNSEVYIIAAYISIPAENDSDDPFYDLYFVVYYSHEQYIDFVHIENQLDYSSQLHELKSENGWYKFNV